MLRLRRCVLASSWSGCGDSEAGSWFGEDGLPFKARSVVLMCELRLRWLKRELSRSFSLSMGVMSSGVGGCGVVSWCIVLM